MRLFPVMAVALLAGGCHDTPARQAGSTDAVTPANTAAPADAQGAVAAPTIAPAAMAAAAPGGFAPLGSNAVQQAIHRALRTGENQRWQDGEWSGYAVPSRDTLANGCRTIRYTIDQQPDAPAATINACDASRP